MVAIARSIVMRSLVLLATYALVSCALVTTAHRAIAVDNANVDSADQAPEVRENTPFKATIPILNTNDRAVRVKLIDSTCTCTKLELKDHFLLPQGRTSLDIDIPSTNRSGPQSVHISLFLSDPEYQPIEIDVWWKVRACIQVDAIGPREDPLERPADKAWQDIYRYVADERPDELNRLRKRIRLSCPEGEAPADGLKVSSIEYPGTIWKFTPVAQPNGSVLIVASARDEGGTGVEGEYHEKVLVHTNHPDKPVIELKFTTILSKDAGRRALDPMNPMGGP
ncbi:MAG: DUF1573 domain-containing protein [Planctomycetes bacterium]|nr:DUF1573 domain-containing protein [Planctomycetota bacterium]